MSSKTNREKHQSPKVNLGSMMKQGWEIAEFEKCLVKVTYTNKIQRKDFKEDGIYPIVSQEKDFINGYWDNEEDVFKVDKPVVIFGDHTQVIKFIDFDFVLGADGVKILKPTDKIDSKYLYYLLKNIDLGSLGYARHYRLLKKIYVAYPKSLSEQQRIVSILDEAFAAITSAKANAEQNLRNAKEIFESYLQGVFEKKGDGWEEKTLGKVCEKISRGIPPKYIDKNGVIVLNQKCIRDHKISLEPSRLHDVYNKNISADKYIQLGDVLVNSTGVGTLGRVAQVRNLPSESATVDTHISIVRPLKEKFYLDFFGWAMIFIENQIKSSGAGASGQTELARTVLENNFTLAYPKSLTEQQNIVKKLDALSTETKKLEAIYNQKIIDLEELKKSVLQKAFTGELKTSKIEVIV